MQGLIYVNGNVLTSKQIARIGTREIELIAGDWNGFVGIGKEKMSGSASEKQLEGSVDEFYVFPCVLESGDVKKVKGFCDRHGK